MKPLALRTRTHRIGMRAPICGRVVLPLRRAALTSRPAVLLREARLRWRQRRPARTAGGSWLLSLSIGATLQLAWPSRRHARQAMRNPALRNPALRDAPADAARRTPERDRLQPEWTTPALPTAAFGQDAGPRAVRAVETVIERAVALRAARIARAARATLRPPAHAAMAEPVALRGPRPARPPTLPVYAIRARAPATTRPARETALVFELQRRIDLVWRGGETVQGPPSFTPRAAPMGCAGAPGTHATVVTPSTPPAAPAFAAQTPSPARVVLDPSVTDRLVDDVIRRVERQVRVDRERRGL